MKPEVFGRYILLSRLGEGAMGEVFLAKAGAVDLGVERLVALKRLSPHLVANGNARFRFFDEANVAAKLDHANIARIYDYGEIDGRCYLAMEYVQGRDLRSIFARHRRIGRPVPIAQACHIGMQVCDGLDYAHRRRDICGRELGIVHRDVSMRNLLVSFDGEVKLIDFGIAKASCRYGATMPGISIKGTPAYMSPEQASGKPLDHRSDVFACGVVLFELLTGRRLFSGRTIPEIWRKIRLCRIPRMRDINPDIPEPLQAIVYRALACHPNQRYQSAGDLQSALLALVQYNGLYTTKHSIAEWMRRIYAREYAVESAQVASMWASSCDSGVASSGGDSQRPLYSPSYRGTVPGWGPARRTTGAPERR
ncbi:MAG: serine/threonine protein kinase [Proteobacteria bacterium]|nr:serine/threonine protein kinase [Pseudomonadota bacterium]